METRVQSLNCCRQEVLGLLSLGSLLEHQLFSRLERKLIPAGRPLTSHLVCLPSQPPHLLFPPPSSSLLHFSFLFLPPATSPFPTTFCQFDLKTKAKTCMGGFPAQILECFGSSPLYKPSDQISPISDDFCRKETCEAEPVRNTPHSGVSPGFNPVPDTKQMRYMLISLILEIPRSQY